jgi:hypothetical protein
VITGEVGAGPATCAVSVHGGGTGEPMSLYERLGQEAGIRTTVDDMVPAAEPVS